MPEHRENSYDAIIIGAGIGGLVCGCYLAKAGMKVLIVEQHDKPGGYCTSFKRKGFLFDAAAHSFGSYREDGNLRKILVDLGIDKLINVKRFNPSDIIITPDFKVTFWNNSNDTINNLINTFPSDKDGIIKYYDYCKSLASTNKLENIKLRNKTFADLLKSFFTNDKLSNSIAFPVFGNGGLPPSLMHAFTGTKIFNEFLIDGGYYTEGGMQRLPDAFVQIIRQNNGKIIYRKLVKKILVKNDMAIGIESEDNESFFAKYVVSACDITQTFKTFLSHYTIDKQFIDKLEKMIPSISTFTLYIGIAKQFRELPQEGVNTWYLPSYDLDKMFHDVESYNLDNFGGGGFMLRVSPDKRTILAFCITSYKTDLFWKQNKNKIANDFLNRIEKVVPNLKKHIAYFDAATPSTQYRYTLNYKGANYGWAPTQSQLFDADFRQKTFIKGLYLTGHWTTQTHGIPGVSYLGQNTANLILQREKNNI